MIRCINYILSLIVCVFASISCVQEMEGIGNEWTEVELTFTFDMDDMPETKAISDGGKVDMLMYAIFNESDELIVRRCSKFGVAGLKGGSEFAMTVTLAKGHNYKAVFWAQNSECQAYAVSDSMTVKVNYDGQANDDFRDAYYGVSEPFGIDDSSVSVVLRRPFAQVNMLAYPFDLEFLEGFHGFYVEKSCAMFRNVPDAINLLDGRVTGSVDAVFTPSAIPAEHHYTDVDEDGLNEEYEYLSMSYILADTCSTTHKADFFFLDKDDKAIHLSDTDLTTLSMKRNNRTDVIGQTLTDNGEINIREYSSPDNLYFNIAQDTVIQNKIYNMTDFGGLQFGSVSGQKTTLNNVFITGDIWTIELGEYRGPNYVKYNNELNNVVLKDLRTTSAIECHEWYFSPAVIAYGNTVLNDCVMTGASTTRGPITDKHGTHEVIPIDFGVRNESDAIINGGEFGNVFVWTHAIVNVYDAHINTLYCGTCDSTNHSWMTVGSGTTIDRIICCEPRCPYGTLEYSTTMTIESGAVVGSIQLVSTDVEYLIIEDGAKVGKITCDGVEYEYEELRSAMGL